MKTAETTDVVRAPVAATNEARDWELIQRAAIAGLRLQMAQELEGIGIDRNAGRTTRVEEREQRLVDLHRAAERALAWNPLAGEIPRRTP